MTAILMMLTNHDELGDTGKKTGWYLPEAAHPWKVFTDAGFDLTWASPEGGVAEMDGVDLMDPVQAEFLESFGSNGPTTVAAESIAPSAYDAIFYVGGHGAMWDFADDETLDRIAMTIYESNGVISAVCHGPAGLTNLKLNSGEYLVTGKNVAAFTDAEEEASGLTNVVPFLLSSVLEKRGAKLVAAANFEAKVVTDGRLITGQNPASARGTAEAVVAALRPRCA
jgi:putative intracellular protease/amidase